MRSRESWTPLTTSSSIKSKDEKPREGYLFSCYTLDKCGYSSWRNMHHAGKDLPHVDHGTALGNPPVQEPRRKPLHNLGAGFSTRKFSVAEDISTKDTAMEDATTLDYPPVTIVRPAWRDWLGGDSRAAFARLTMVPLFVLGLLLLARRRYRHDYSQGAQPTLARFIGSLATDSSSTEERALVSAPLVEHRSPVAMSAAECKAPAETVAAYWMWWAAANMLGEATVLPPLSHGLTMLVCSAGPGELLLLAQAVPRSRDYADLMAGMLAPASDMTTENPIALTLRTPLKSDMIDSRNKDKEELELSLPRAASHPGTLSKIAITDPGRKRCDRLRVEKDQDVDRSLRRATLEGSNEAQGIGDAVKSQIAMAPLEPYYRKETSRDQLSTALRVDVEQDMMDELAELDSPSKGLGVAPSGNSKGQWFLHGQNRTHGVSPGRDKESSRRSMLWGLPIKPSSRAKSTVKPASPAPSLVHEPSTFIKTKASTPALSDLPEPMTIARSENPTSTDSSLPDPAAVKRDNPPAQALRGLPAPIPISKRKTTMSTLEGLPVPVRIGKSDASLPPSTGEPGSVAIGTSRMAASSGKIPFPCPAAGVSSSGMKESNTRSSSWTLPGQIRSAPLINGKDRSSSATKGRWALPGQTGAGAASRGRDNFRSSSSWALGKARRASLSPDAEDHVRFSLPDLEPGGAVAGDEDGDAMDSKEESPSVSAPRTATAEMGKATVPRSILKIGDAKPSRSNLHVHWCCTLVEEDPVHARQRAQRAAKWLRPKRVSPRTAAPRKSRAASFARSTA